MRRGLDGGRRARTVGLARRGGLRRRAALGAARLGRLAAGALEVRRIRVAAPGGGRGQRRRAPLAAIASQRHLRV